MPAAKPIPDGFHSLTPHIVVKGAAKAIDFYKQAFGAEEINRAAMPDGSIMHALLRVGDSMLMLNDEFPQMHAMGPTSIGGTAVTLHLYVQDADKAWQRAVQAGAKVKMPIADMLWGDRYGIVSDPFGHDWAIATHTKDLAPDQIMAAAKASMSGPPPGKKS
jgi:PhnB protein